MTTESSQKVMIFRLPLRKFNFLFPRNAKQKIKEEMLLTYTSQNT